MTAEALGINKKHEDIIIKIYNLCEKDKAIEEKLFSILEIEPKVDFLEKARAVFKDTDNLELRLILGLDSPKPLIELEEVRNESKKIENTTTVIGYHCVRIKREFFELIAENTGHDLFKSIAVQRYLGAYYFLNKDFFIVNGVEDKDITALSRYFSYVGPNKLNLIPEDKANYIDIKNIASVLTEKIEKYLHVTKFPNLDTEQDYVRYLHYLIDVISEKLEDSTEFFIKVNKIISLEKYNVREAIESLKNDYLDIIPAEFRDTTSEESSVNDKSVEVVSERKKACKLHKKFAFYKILKMQFTKDVTVIDPQTFEPKDIKNHKYSLPIYDKNHITFVVDISTDQDDLESSLELKSKNFENKYKRYYRDNNKGEEPPENWLILIKNDNIFVKSHVLNDEKIWLYSDKKHDDSFVSFDDLAYEIDPQDLYWIDTYLPSYNYKSSDSVIQDEKKLFDEVSKASEEEPENSVLVTKISNILKQYESYNRNVTDKIIPHYTHDKELINFLIKIIKEELKK